MDIIIEDAPKNARCMECGGQFKQLISIRPDKIHKKLKFCVPCFKKNFKGDIKVKI